MRKSLKPIRYVVKATVSVLPPGPPYVSTKMSPKSLVRSMSRIITPTTMVNLSNGSVMDQKRCQGLAPSTLAASYSSWGIDCSPASSTSIMKGVLCQTSTKTTATMEMNGDENQSRSEEHTSEL